MIKPSHLLKYVIRPTLYDARLGSPAAEKLLFGTAAQESHGGYFLKQIKGPALGIYQMEPATHDSLWEHYLNHRPRLAKEGLRLKGVGRGTEALLYNLRYATFMARIKYFADPNPLPHADDIPGIAAYWKRVYNTAGGKGTVEEFMHNYYKMMEG